MRVVRKAKEAGSRYLDRLSRLRAGLSDGQKNDFAMWKDTWDDAMVAVHGTTWAETFAGWVQNILDDTAANAFSQCMHDETVRVLSSRKALAVPGS